MTVHCFATFGHRQCGHSFEGEAVLRVWKAWFKVVTSSDVLIRFFGKCLYKLQPIPIEARFRSPIPVSSQWRPRGPAMRWLLLAPWLRPHVLTHAAEVEVNSLGEPSRGCRGSQSTLLLTPGTSIEDVSNCNRSIQLLPVEIAWNNLSLCLSGMPSRIHTSRRVAHSIPRGGPPRRRPAPAT